MNNKLKFLNLITQLVKENKEPILEKIMSLKDNIDLETIYGEFFKDTHKPTETQSETTTVKEKTDKYELKRFGDGLYMEVPGFNKENVDISIDKKTNIISVRGKFKIHDILDIYEDFNVTYSLDSEEVIDRVKLENGLLIIFLKPVEKENIKIIIE